MKAFYLLFFILIVSVCNAQTRFQKTYGGGADDVGYCIIQTSDGGYLICGYTTSFGNGGRDAYVIKTDSMGTEKWSKSFGGLQNDEATYAIEDNGSYLIGGYTRSYGAGNADGFLARMDLLGNIQWLKTYGTVTDDSHLIRFRKTIDNGIIIAYPYRVNGYYSFTLIKTDNNGSLSWQRTYGGTQLNASGDIVQFPDSGFLISGYTAAYGSGANDLMIMRTDSLGNMIYTKTLGSLLNETGGYSIVSLNVSEALITGQADNGLFGLSDLVSIRVNYFTGAVVSANEYGKTGKYFQTYSAAATKDTGFVYALNDFNGSAPDMRILKTDSAGTVVWTRKYGGAGYDVAYGIAGTKDNGSALVGYTTSYGTGGADVYFVKTDVAGESSCYEPPDTLKKGTFNYTPTLPAIPLVSPADLYNSYSSIVVTANADSVSDICYRATPTSCQCSNLGPELIVNGDFSLGNTGFFSDYTYNTQAQPGRYGIYTDAQTPNSGSWSPCLDHTTGTGNLLWMDASDVTYGLTMWGSTFTVKPNTNYVFSYWYENVNNAAPPGQLSFTINSVLQGNLVIAPQQACQWTQQCITWNSGLSTTATIRILNMAFFYNGNDFAFDDFSFRECPAGLTSSFASSDTSFCGEAGKCINFVDHSVGNPISWHWFFPGAIPDSSLQQNPTNICYYNTGTYPVTLIVTDSTGTDTMTVSPMIIYRPTPNPPSITSSGDTVTCPPSTGYSYQWFLNGLPIAGANNSFYVALTTGTYSVRITDSLGCSALSNGLYVVITEAQILNHKLQSIKIFPNPATDQLIIEYGEKTTGNYQLSIYNVLGEKVHEQEINSSDYVVVNIKNLARGVYFVLISNEGGCISTKFVKE